MHWEQLGVQYISKYGLGIDPTTLLLVPSTSVATNALLSAVRNKLQFGLCFVSTGGNSATQMVSL